MNQNLIDEITQQIEEMDTPEVHEVIPVEIEEPKSEQEVEVIKYNSMKEDLDYSIGMLRNNINNSERLLNKLTLDMLEADPDDIDAMTERYTKLDAGMNKNIELLQKARKDISIVIANLNKAKAEKVEIKSITNTVNIDGGDNISTADVIARMKEGK